MLILETLHRVTTSTLITNLFTRLDDLQENAFGCAQYVFIISWFALLAVHLLLLWWPTFEYFMQTYRVALGTRWAFVCTHRLRSGLSSGFAIFVASFSPVSFSMGFVGRCRGQGERGADTVSQLLQTPNFIDHSWCNNHTFWGFAGGFDSFQE